MGGTLRTSGARARLQKIAREAELRTHLAIRQAAELALAVSREHAPGGLPETLSVRAVNQYAVRVSSSSGVAIFHENGTAPHDIAPKDGRTLAFQVNGAWVFAKRVRHPGNKALQFMHRGMEAGKAYLREALRNILRG